GVGDVDLEPETNSETMPSIKQEAVTYDNVDKLRDLDYLRSHFYTVDPRTALTAEDFDVDTLLSQNLMIDNTVEGPKVLIFHTHSGEMYSDSNTDDPMDGVMGVGAKLASLLTNVYNIETIQHTGRYDVVNGKSRIQGAYERMEPEVEQILRDYPSIQVALDLHRDGVAADRRLVTTINGQSIAQVMFFNGLCKVNRNGELTEYSLKNPYIPVNLALSLSAQLTANSLYPNFTRKIYLNAYRYSLNMLPKSMLLEVGAQTNTKEEALNAMDPLAYVLAQVLL
ncbi:MAG: stage II sporulation protein P, partial [Clostridiales bacterium]|nr:stage II sporulation protein P [Clostridiales bacterium]